MAANRNRDPEGTWESLNMISGVSTCDTRHAHTPTHGGHYIPEELRSWRSSNDL